MTHEPELDPQVHEDDTVMSVWKRRLLLAFLIALVIAVAAPAFQGCTGALKRDEMAARFTVNGRDVEVSREELGRFVQRFTIATRVVRGYPMLPEGDEGEKEALRRLMLDELAKDAGIEVPDATLAAEIESRPQFQMGGKFDEKRFREEISGYAQYSFSREDLVSMLRVEMRSAQYERLAFAAFQVVPGDAAYDSWKTRNQKLTVEFAVSPFAAQKAKIDAMEPTETQLSSVTSMPRARELLAVPPKKTVEVAYIKVNDLSAEQFAAAKKYLEDAEILNEEQTLESEGFRTYWMKRDTVFTRERWGLVQDPEYARKRREYEEKKAKWEKEDPATRPATLEDPPKDPAADYPVDDNARKSLWKDRVEKEAVAELVMNDLGRKADASGKPLSETAAEYARFGVKVARNAEPYTDAEIVEKFPDPVARDSEFDIVVKSTFRAPAEGQVFRRQFQAKALPTTRLSERMDDRGFMVLSLEGADPARQYTFAEKPEVMKDFWKKQMVAESAKELAAAVQKKAEDAGPETAKRVEALRAAAKEAGLEVATASRFTRSTPLPIAPAAAPGEKLSPEVEAVAQRIKYRTFVQQQYPTLLNVEPGKFLNPVFPDDKTEAVYAILVVEKHEPAPLEMRDADVQSAKSSLFQQSFSKYQEINGYEALAKRMGLVRLDLKAAEKPEKPKETE